MSFLTPGFFDALVLIVIVVGLILAALRIYGDFQRGPRWRVAQHSPEQEQQEKEEQKEQP
jgi:hypothetical protein